MAAVKITAKAIADLVEDGHEIILSHGNGPQVGMLQIAMQEYAARHQEPPAPLLSVCVAMSQGYIGYDLQNALREELIDRGIPQGRVHRAYAGARRPRRPCLPAPHQAHRRVHEQRGSR